MLGVVKKNPRFVAGIFILILISYLTSVTSPL